VAPDAARAAAPIAKLRALNPENAAEVDSLVRGAGEESQIGFLPMRAGKRDMSVIVRKKDGAVVALVPLRPWEY
jgi:hypothetical protein